MWYTSGIRVYGGVYRFMLVIYPKILEIVDLKEVILECSDLKKKIYLLRKERDMQIYI